VDNATRRLPTGVSGGLRRWLLTTTFPGINENRDVDDGDWRALNFRCAPFFFPEPAARIIEGCPEASGDYSDKSLVCGASATCRMGSNLRDIPTQIDIKK
jgi:hypothetical protein